MTTSRVYSEWNQYVVLAKLMTFNCSKILLQTLLGHANMVSSAKLISNNDFHIARKYAKITKLTRCMLTQTHYTARLL